MEAAGIYERMKGFDLPSPHLLKTVLEDPDGVCLSLIETPFSLSCSSNLSVYSQFHIVLLR